MLSCAPDPKRGVLWCSWLFHPVSVLATQWRDLFLSCLAKSGFRSLKGRGPLDGSLGGGAWTTARGGGKWSLWRRAVKSAPPQGPSRKAEVSHAHSGEHGLGPGSPTTQGLAKAPKYQRLLSPLGPSAQNPSSITQPLAGSACTCSQKRRQISPTLPSPLSPSSTLQRLSGSEETRMLGVLSERPLALVYREPANRTSQLRMSAQWQGGGAVYICLTIV